MESSHQPIPFEPFFGGFILETLTIGMYGETRNAIREYIQNGFDSIRKATSDLKLLKPGEGLMEIELAADRNSLTIRDNGSGLSAKSAATVLTRVGASAKNYRQNAGFRGIGRLAGIVFSDTVSFTTKAKGERDQTTVIFKAKAMREAMAPARGSSKSAHDLMRESVEAFRSPSLREDAHFFEVKLEGFTDPPDECRSAKEMYDFLSQVAPVPYPEDFPFKAKLQQAAESLGIPIEEVRITIKDGNDEPLAVTKRYGATYEFESGTIALSDCSIYESPARCWWAWVGKKGESGAYTDARVSGLRVRVRNIQVDGTTLVRDIFRDRAKSHVRFQDYFVGEIFVDPSAVVPNARRDGFEEDSSWKSMRDELAEVVVKDLGRNAYRVSKQGQLSLDALRRNLKTAEKELRELRKSEFADTDRVVSLSKNITTYQSRVAQSTLGADLETAAALQAIGSALADLKHELQAHLGPGVAHVDREKVQQEARTEFLQEILAVLEEALSPDCYATARGALMQEFG